MRVLALHGRANLCHGSRVCRAHPGGEKIDRSAEALRASHGLISFPPNEAPVQRYPDDGMDKSAGRGSILRRVISSPQAGNLT